jgi:streptogramin lyase
LLIEALILKGASCAAASNISVYFASLAGSYIAQINPKNDSSTFVIESLSPV